MDSQRNATDVRCNFSMSKDRFAVFVWNRICPRFSLSFFRPLCSPLFSGGWMEGALMWHAQCCDHTPKRNQMLFGLACGAEAYSMYIYTKKEERKDCRGAPVEGGWGGGGGVCFQASWVYCKVSCIKREEGSAGKTLILQHTYVVGLHLGSNLQNLLQTDNELAEVETACHIMVFRSERLNWEWNKKKMKNGNLQNI